MIKFTFHNVPEAVLGVTPHFMAWGMLPVVTLHLLFAHYVSVNGKLVPDVLEPWDGSQRSTEETNQPIWVQITVPQGTAPGNYVGSVSLVADGTPTVIPISARCASRWRN